MDTIPEDHIVQIHHGDRDQYAAETSFAVAYSNTTSASAVVDLDPDQTEDESNDSVCAHGNGDKYGDQTDDEFYDGDPNGYHNGNVRKDEHIEDPNGVYQSRDQIYDADENSSDPGVHESHQTPNDDPSEPVQNGIHHDPDITHVPSDPETFSNSDYGSSGSTTQLGVQSQSHPNYAHMVGTAQKYVVDKKKKKSPAKKARKCCGGIIMLGLFFFILISILIGFYIKPARRKDKENSGESRSAGNQPSGSTPTVTSYNPEHTLSVTIAVTDSIVTVMDTSDAFNQDELTTNSGDQR